jgi:cysteinyl-tRNA synthetase
MNRPSFFNTLTRSKESFHVEERGTVSLYTCGPTVYDYAHIGNFRAYVFEDLLQRYLLALGYTVRRVMNFTDVDDKTIRNSRGRGMRLADFTAIYKAAFLEDLRALNILVPEQMPSATAFIPAMIDMIRQLEGQGIAYLAEDGSVYYRIARFPSYGQLAHLNLEDLRPSGRVSHDEYEKEQVGDFALWKSASEEDGENGWDSPWGRGRPGWHIECSAMARSCLGDEVDIHCGGVDNIFPHHEAEIAQSEACSGKKFVKLWMHCAHLMVNGQKMSKSAGNFYTLRDLQALGFTGRQVRYALLSVHYRLPLNFTMDELEAVKQALARLDAWVKRLESVANPSSASTPAAWREDFLAALGDDLNMSKALAVVFEAVRETHRGLDQGTLSADEAFGHLAAWREVDRVLGLGESSAVTVPPEVLALVEARATARKEKRWAESDRLRDEIKAQGWLVKDTPKGQDLAPLA